MVAGAKGHEAKRPAWDLIDDATKKAAEDFRGSFSGFERNRLFVACPGLDRRVEAGAPLGLDFDHDGRAVAPIDVDGDGDLDLALLSLQGVQLLLNTSPPRSWARLTMRATETEPSALGAEVTVRAGGHAQLDRVQLTAGFHTQVSPELHFGLGTAETFDVEVRWPSGKVEQHRGLAAKRRYTLLEGGPIATPRPLPAWPEATRPVVGRRFDATVTVDGLDGEPAPLAAAGPVLVNFWAPWCEGCDREMPALAALGRRGALRVVGVSAETKDLASVSAFLARHGVDYPQRLANDAAVTSFFGAEGEMTLPASFLFDGAMRLRRTWFRRVDVDEIEAALADAPVSAADYTAQATMWQNAGDNVSALQAMREAARMDPDDLVTQFNLATAASIARQFDESERALRFVLSRAPKHVLAWEVLVKTLDGSGRPKAARAAAKEGLDRLPHHPFLKTYLEESER